MIMRDFDICSMQGEIFKFYCINNYDMKDFCEKYMNSDFCKKQFDIEYSYFHECFVEDAMYFINSEITVNQNSKYTYNPDIAWWIGFMYKKIQLKAKKSSRYIYSFFSYEFMETIYLGYHTIDDDLAADLLLEKLKENE